MLSKTQAGNTVGELKHTLVSLNSYLYSLNSLLELDSTMLWSSKISWQHPNSEQRAALPPEGTVATFEERICLVRKGLGMVIIECW